MLNDILFSPPLVTTPLSIINEEKQISINRLKEKVDPNSVVTIMSLGGKAEKDLVWYTDTLIDRIQAADSGAAHEDLSQLLNVTMELNPDRLKRKPGSFSRLFFNTKTELIKFSERFKTARQQIDGITRNLQERMDEARVSLGRVKDITDRHSAPYNQNASDTKIPKVLKTLELVERHFERGLYDFSQKDRFDLDVALESLNADLRANRIFLLDLCPYPKTGCPLRVPCGPHFSGARSIKLIKAPFALEMRTKSLKGTMLEKDVKMASHHGPFRWTVR